MQIGKVKWGLFFLFFFFSSFSFLPYSWTIATKTALYGQYAGRSSWLADGMEKKEGGCVNLGRATARAPGSRNLFGHTLPTTCWTNPPPPLFLYFILFHCFFFGEEGGFSYLFSSLLLLTLDGLFSDWLPQLTCSP